MRAWPVVMMALFVAGCGTWVKPGASEGDYQRDRALCDHEARQAFPQDMRWSFTGYEPRRRVCRKRGETQECWWEGGRPRYNWVDLNQSARAEDSDRCVIGRGWRYQTRKPGE